MSGWWGGVLGPVHPSSSLTPASLPGLNPSTAFSTRTRTGVLCRSRATSLLGDPRPKSLALPQVHVGEQCCPRLGSVGYSRQGQPGPHPGRYGRPAGAPADRQASPQPRAGPGELALWERRTVLGAWEGAGICLPGLHPVPLTCWREDSRPGSGVRCCPLEVTVGRLACCSRDATLPTPGLEPSQGLCLHWELPTRVQTLWTAVLLGAAYSWPGCLHSEATFLGSLGREVLPEGPQRHFSSTLTRCSVLSILPPSWGPQVHETAGASCLGPPLQ